MKKNLSIYFVLLFSVLSLLSCGSSDQEEVVLSPYALVKSFRIGNIRSGYPGFTADGRDTITYRTVSFENVAYTIDQLAGEIYNNDSLPYATNVSKVLVMMGVKGVASIYVDSTGTYEHVTSTDSIDFTTPRKIRVYSADASFYKDYTASVNVHQVDPDMMVWHKYPAVAGVVPVKALEHDGGMFLFGKNESGAAVVAVTALDDAEAWACTDVVGLPADALETIALFGGKFYAVYAGDVYASADGAVWNSVAAGTGAVAIVGVSEAESKLWIAGNSGVLCSTDGISFEVEEGLPADFPLYGVSLASYPLTHNNKIIRYMLVGYATPEMDGDAAVWSRLSTESKWTRYNNEGNNYPCPSLKGLSVLRYDGFLYALGGAGKVNGADTDAFSMFYVSRDNGIAWRPQESYYQRLPEELGGDNSQFAATVDSSNYIWIINSGDNGGVWKGILNRLGFKK